MSEYVTDPSLLDQLNETSYVSDPELLAKLNGSETDAVDAMGNLSMQAGNTAAAKLAPVIPGAVGAEVGSWGRVIPQIGVTGAKDLVKETLRHPLYMGKELAKAYVQGHSIYGPIAQELAGQTFGQAAGTLGRGALGVAGQVVAAPEAAFMYPYNMAAYEQEKIRQNPTAPGLEYNPYAQTVRGEASTQGRAGAANQMRATANMPYGNVTPQERQMLDEDMKMRNAIRKKAFEKVMGPVAPGSF